MDNGATDHLTNDMNYMHITKAFLSTSKLFVGNGSRFCITHIGHAMLKMNNSNTSPILKLNNLLLVPKITKILISISQMTKDKNVVVEFTDKICFVKDNVKNLIMLQGKAEKGLYKLLFVSYNKILPLTICQGHVVSIESVVTDAPLSMFSAVKSNFKNKKPCLHTATNDYMIPNVC